MHYGTINGSTKKISRIVFGGDRSFGNDNRMLDYAFDQGINAFDTARVYAGSEAVLGRWLRSHRRDEVFILTKGAYPSRRLGHRLRERAVMRDLDRSLAELNTDFIDAYFFHYDSISVPESAVVDIVQSLKASGKVGVVGYSNFALERLKKIYGVAGARAPAILPSIVSAQMSLPVPNETLWPWPGSVSISGKQHKPTRQWYADNNLAVFAYSSLGRGFFSTTELPDDQNRGGSAKTVSAPARSSWFKRGIDRLKGREVPVPHDVWLRIKFASAANNERLRRASSLAVSKGATAAQVGLAYLFKKNLNLFATIGCSSEANWDANIRALDIQLSEQEVAWLDADDYS